MSNTNKAFTLAEVLVTLGIIGVVSAMTVPTLMQNYQRKTYVTQLHKIFNEMSQAGLRAINDNNAVSLKETKYSSPSNTSTFFRTYFKVVKDCGTDVRSCLASSYDNMNGQTVTTPATISNTSCVAIASGAVICLSPHYRSVNDEGATLLVDTNGLKGPNIIGRDFFNMLLAPSGSVIANDSEARYQEMMRAWCESSQWSEPELCNSETQGLNTKTYPPIDCAKASDLTGGSAAACFGNILSNNWEMEY